MKVQEKVKPAYNGSEEDFPTCAGMISHSCLTNINAFSKHKPVYNKAFVQEILDRIKASSSIPNIEQRQAQSVLLCKVVAKSAAITANNFLTLGSYIESAFSEDDVPAMKKLAGGTYYITARYKWSDATTMSEMMATFMDVHAEALINAGMPAEFPAKCATNSDTFSTALSAYEDYKGIAEQQGQQKIMANNGVFKSLKGIMKDGKLIYRSDAVTKKQFTWSDVLAKVTKNRRTGFTIKVRAPEEGKFITTAQLSLNGESKPFPASAKGIITAKVPEGKYTGVITAPGYVPLTVNFISDKGVTHREEVTLSIVVANVG